MKLARRATVTLGCAAALALLGAGCGGINASKSVSPLDFLLPGLLKADPPPTPFNEPVPSPVPAVATLAQIN